MFASINLFYIVAFVLNTFIIMIVDSAICNTSDVNSIVIGQNCFTFMVESCSQGCNFNSADQVCKEEGAKLAEPQGHPCIKGKFPQGGGEGKIIGLLLFWGRILVPALFFLAFLEGFCTFF